MSFKKYCLIYLLFPFNALICAELIPADSMEEGEYFWGSDANVQEILPQEESDGSYSAVSNFLFDNNTVNDQSENSDFASFKSSFLAAEQSDPQQLSAAPQFPVCEEKKGTHSPLDSSDIADQLNNGNYSAYKNFLLSLGQQGKPQQPLTAQEWPVTEQHLEYEFSNDVKKECVLSAGQPVAAIKKLLDELPCATELRLEGRLPFNIYRDVVKYLYSFPNQKFLNMRTLTINLNKKYRSSEGGDRFNTILVDIIRAFPNLEILNLEYTANIDSLINLLVISDVQFTHLKKLTYRKKVKLESCINFKGKYPAVMINPD